MNHHAIILTVLVLPGISGCFLRPSEESSVKDPEQMTVNAEEGSPSYTKTFDDGMATDHSVVSLAGIVREVIRPDCGSCHTSTLSTAKPGAIQIFDLAHDTWYATMSNEQLLSFRNRLSKLDPLPRSHVAALVDSLTRSGEEH